MSKKQSNPLPSKGMVKPAPPPIPPPPSPYTKIEISKKQLEILKKVGLDIEQAVLALGNQMHKISITMQEFVNALAKIKYPEYRYEKKENDNERT